MIGTMAQSWKSSLAGFVRPQSIGMLFLGISAGIPLLLIFSSLSLWLREAGVDRSTVTFFSWAALAYSFKFIWAPIVSLLPLPLLTRLLGQRRGWLLLAQGMIMVSIVLMGMIDPASGEYALVLMAFAAVGLGFSSATQDIVIDAYRIESAGVDYQALLSSMYIAGYRIGMIISGAGALYLAEIFGSDINRYSYTAWQHTYFCMAGTVLVGVLTTLLVNEPTHIAQSDCERHYTHSAYVRFFLFFVTAILGFIGAYYLSGGLADMARGMLKVAFNNGILSSALVGFSQLIFALIIAAVIFYFFITLRWVDKNLVTSSYVSPVVDFFKRFSGKQVILILLLIAFYRVSDLVLGAIANIFYQDLGFTKSEIAQVVKVFGLIMTLLGGFLGGLLSIRYGVIKTLALGAFLTVVTNLLFMLLANAGHDVSLFYMVISADNLAGGLASAAFVAYLSSLVNLSFTASQYAIFSSIMTLFPKILAGYSGSLVDWMGYPQFFFYGSLIGLPVLWVIYLLRDVDCGSGV